MHGCDPLLLICSQDRAKYQKLNTSERFVPIKGGWNEKSDPDGVWWPCVRSFTYFLLRPRRNRQILPSLHSTAFLPIGVKIAIFRRKSAAVCPLSSFRGIRPQRSDIFAFLTLERCSKATRRSWVKFRISSARAAERGEKLNCAVFFDVFRDGVRLPKSLVLPLHYGVKNREICRILLPSLSLR